MILVRLEQRIRIFLKDFESILNQKCLFKAVLKPLPFRHPKCEYKSGWSPDIHAQVPSAQSEGFGFSEVVLWQTYAVRSGVR